MTAKVRPCLILSVPILDQDRALVALVPHTTSVRGSRFEVGTKTRFLRPGAFDTQNVVTIPHSKLVRRLGKLSGEALSRIEETVRLWLGL